MTGVPSVQIDILPSVKLATDRNDAYHGVIGHRGCEMDSALPTDLAM